LSSYTPTKKCPLTFLFLIFRAASLRNKLAKCEEGYGVIKMSLMKR
jgi:hypothetical protein